MQMQSWLGAGIRGVCLGKKCINPTEGSQAPSCHFQPPTIHSCHSLALKKKRKGNGFEVLSIRVNLARSRMDPVVGDMTCFENTSAWWLVKASDARSTRNHSIRSVRSPTFDLPIGNCCFSIESEFSSFYKLKLLRLSSIWATRLIKLRVSGMDRVIESAWTGDIEPCLKFEINDDWFRKTSSCRITISCEIGEKSTKAFRRKQDLCLRPPGDRTKMGNAESRSESEKVSPNGGSVTAGEAVKQEASSSKIVKVSPNEGSVAVGEAEKQDSSISKSVDKLIDDFKDILFSKKDKDVALKVEGQDKPETTRSKSTAKHNRDLKDILLSGKDSDVVLKVEGKEFKAHRLIMGMRSPVFSAMFEHEMKEKSSGVVVIEDCDCATFPDFLHYIYTGAVEKLSSDNAPQLYIAADKYQLLELKEECLEYMKNNISVDNFCDFLTLSLRHQETDLTRIATQFFLENASDITVTVKWMTFLSENVVAGNELIVKLVGSKRKQ